MGRSVLLALCVGLVPLLPCVTFEVTIEEGNGAELAVDFAWNVVVLCAALDLRDVAVGEVEGMGRVVKAVDTIVGSASELMDNVVVDCTALDVC